MATLTCQPLLSGCSVIITIYCRILMIFSYRRLLIYKNDESDEMTKQTSQCIYNCISSKAFIYKTKQTHLVKSRFELFRKTRRKNSGDFSILL